MRRSVPVDRLGDLLGSGRGLSTAEARARLERFGRNDVVETPEPAWRALARETVRDPMIWFLVGTAAIYLALGDVAEASVLAASIVPLAGMDAFLHRRTQASTEGLRRGLATRAQGIRDGAEREIEAADLVPGDLVVVASGGTFPADGVLEGAEALQVDEAVLTGESYPVRKVALPVSEPIGPRPVDARHWGFTGTRVLAGRAALRITHTGAETLYGEIVRSAAAGPRARTPLQIAVSSLVRGLVVAALLVCATLAVVRLRQGFGWLDALLSAVTLAVAALPEEFPVVLTFFLGVGVYRLARRRALVRRAVSVENLGRVTSICSDKTGTLTEGDLRLTHLVPAEGVSDSALLAAAGCAARGESGDPIDVAVVAAAQAAGVAADARGVRATFPFTEDRRRETSIQEDSPGLLLAATKGSPEVVLAACGLPTPDRDAWRDRVEQLAREGHKVIACADRPIDAAEWAGGEPDRGFRFRGLLAFEDPVRKGVAEAVGRCRAAGIHVLMVTGDHPGTAAAVARELGLGGGAPTVIEAEALELAAGARAGVDLRRVDVIARAVPTQKLAIVRSLQAAGEIVAVTGDGVNDVPALQAADVGIAMGERGTRSAREVAAIVLLDDDFGSIVAAIGEGRQLFANLQRSFAYLLLVHLPLVASAALIPLAGYPLLFLPIHIVWLELVIHPSALLGFQQRANDAALDGTPRQRDTRFLSRGGWLRVSAAGVVLTAAMALAYGRGLEGTGGVEHGRSLAIVTLIAASAGFLAVLSRLRTRAARWLVAASLASAALLTQPPAIAARLHLRPLHADDWLLVFAAALLACVPLLIPRRSQGRGTGF